MNPHFLSFLASCIAACFTQPVVAPSDPDVAVKAGTPMPRPDSNQTILVEINVYQFKAPQPGEQNAGGAGVAEVGAGSAPAGAPASGTEAPEVADPSPDAAVMIVAASDDAVRIFGKEMRLDSPELDAFRISAPRILCRAGQPASIMIGRELEYLEPAGEKLYRAVTGPELFEGLKVEVTASGLRGPINVDRLTIRLSECLERQKIDGLDLPAGKPVMRTREVSTQFTIEPGQRGLIPIKADGQQERPEHLLVVVRLERAAAQPAAVPDK